MRKISGLFYLVVYGLTAIWPKLLLAHGDSDSLTEQADHHMMDGINGVGNMMGSWNFFGTGFGFMIVFWVIFIGIFIVLVRWIAGQGWESSQSSSEILKQRYAKGEIDRKEFEQTKKDLE